jgi:hypothetical protein
MTLAAPVHRSSYATGQPYPQTYELVRFLSGSLKVRAAKTSAYMQWTKAWLERPAPGGNSALWGKDSKAFIKRETARLRKVGIAGPDVYTGVVDSARALADSASPLDALGWLSIANRLDGGNYPYGFFYASEIPPAFRE